jgi:predicted P-loop ATPase
MPSRLPADQKGTTPVVQASIVSERVQVESALAIWAPDIHQENGSPFYSSTIGVLLSEPFERYPDACLLPYICSPARRLGVADAASPDVVIAWVPIDLDAPTKGKPELRGTPLHLDWQARQLALAERFEPAPAVWESPSGGLRLLWSAAPGSVTPLDYNVRCEAFLEELREFGFEGIDPTTAQWVRHQRLPRGGDVLGTPGVLTLPPAPEGATLARPMSFRDPTSEVVDTILFRMFEAADLPIGDVYADKARVCCPWDSEHSDSNAPGYDPLSGRAVILADVQGKGMGVFKCAHGHCAHRGNADVLKLLSAESRDAAQVLAEHDARNSALAHSLLETVESIAPAVQEAMQAAANDPHAALADWRFRLQLKAKGATVPSAYNVGVTFEWHPLWRGVFGWNEMANDIILLRDAPVDWSKRAGERWTADDSFALLTWFEKELQIKPPAHEICDAVKHVAQLRGSFHPVRDYLRSVRWDGVSRSFCTYLGAAPTEYHRAACSTWLRSAVARVMQPGCKADNVLILEGVQGAKKSTALRTLASDEWFYEACGDIGDKDFAQDMRGMWVGEIPEIDRLIASKDESSLKAMVSKLVDRYRPSYGRASQDFPRQVVFGGTTNKDDYLRDVTGNRRYLPVVCGPSIDIPSLRRDRDQLWAQAVAEYDAGDIWWLTGEVERSAIVEQGERVEQDVWAERIEDWVVEQDRPFTTNEALDKLPGAKAAAELNQGDKNRMGRALRGLGFELYSSWRDGKKGRFWRRPASQ